MHDNCSGNSGNGKQIADKVRMMGFDTMQVPEPLLIDCTNCGKSFKMETMLSACPSCRMVYAVTPCSANSADNVMAVDIDY